MANIITPNQGQGQTTNQPKIDISTSKPITCADCGYDVFLPAVKMRKISKLITGTPQDVLLPMNVYCCGQCGAVLNELVPNEIKQLESQDKKDD